MKTHAFIISIVLTATAFGQVDTAKPSASPIQSFESPGLLEAKRFIPASVMSGPLHKVNARTHNDSLVNTYFLQAEGTEVEVPTGLALQIRVREVYAIAALRKMNKEKEIVDGAVGEGGREVKSLTGIVFNPFGTIKNVPRGASRFFGRIGEGLKGGSKEDTYGEGSILQNLAGVQTARVALAAKLGVSPYSHNQELQRLLTANARASAAGSLIVNGAEAPVAGPAGAALTVIGANETLQQTLATTDPNDLRIMSRKKLFALGVNREQADEFLIHAWYSPWHEAIIADALTTIGVDPTAFLAQACKAQTEEDAVFFQRLAQVLAAYQTKKTALKSIDVNNGIVSAMDADGKLVVPLSCDYAIWAEQASGRVEELSSLGKNRPEVKGLTFWVDGKVSDRGRDALKARNIDLVTGVLDKEASPAKPN